MAITQDDAVQKARYLLRQLLKRAPLLVRGLDIGLLGTIDSIKSLVQTFLIDPVDSRDLAWQLWLAHDLDVGGAVFPKIGDLKRYFEEMHQEHAIKLQQAQLLDTLSIQQAQIRKRSQLAVGELPRLLAWHKVGKMLREKDRVFCKAAAFIENPAAFHTTLREWIVKYKQDVEREFGPAYPLQDLFFFNVARGIDFFGYRASRQDLALLDMALADYLRRARLKMELSSPVAVSVSKNLRLFVEVGHTLVRAYEANADPLNKLWQIQHATQAILESVVLRFGEMTSDGRTEVLKLLYSYINPPNLASAFGYMLDFIGGARKAYRQYDASRALEEQFSVLWRMMAEWLERGKFGMDAWALSRGLQLDVVAVVGSSSPREKRVSETICGLSDVTGLSVATIRDGLLEKPGSAVSCMVPHDETMIGAHRLKLHPAPRDADGTMRDWHIADDLGSNKEDVGCVIWYHFVPSSTLEAMRKLFDSATRASRWRGQIAKIVVYNDDEKQNVFRRLAEFGDEENGMFYVHNFPPIGSELRGLTVEEAERDSTKNRETRVAERIKLLRSCLVRGLSRIRIQEQNL
jgi:hypothetical protein